MERRLILFHVLHHQKLQLRSFASNYKICHDNKCMVSCRNFCSGIRNSNNTHTCINNFEKLSSGAITHELNEHSKTELFLSSEGGGTEDGTDLPNQQHKDSGKDDIHSCGQIQQHLISLPTKSSSTFSDTKNQFRGPLQRKTCRQYRQKILGTLLHRIYWNLKENKLIPDKQAGQDKAKVTVQSKENYLYKLAAPSSRKAAVGSQDVQARCSQSCQHHGALSLMGSVSEDSRSSVACSPSGKELFNYNMYIKYQIPTSEEGEASLSSLY